MSTATLNPAIQTLTSLILPSSLVIAPAGSATTSVPETSLSSTIQSATTQAVKAAVSKSPAQIKAAAETAKWNDRMPVVYLVGCAVFLGIWLILDHPRFFARLFSSKKKTGPRRVSSSGESSEFTPSSATSVTSSTRGLLKSGEIWDGWVLKSGTSPKKDDKKRAFHYQQTEKRPSPQSSPSTFYSEKFPDQTGAQVIKRPEDAYAFSPAKATPGEGVFDNWVQRGGFRPTLERIQTNVLAPNEKLEGGKEDPKHLSAVPSLYSQDSTYVDHDTENVQARELKRSMSSHRKAVPRSTPFETIPEEALERRFSRRMSSLASALFNGGTHHRASLVDTPILSAISPTAGNAHRRMTIFQSDGEQTNTVSPPTYIRRPMFHIPGVEAALLYIPFKRLLPQMTVGAFLISLLYIGLVIAASFYKCTNWDWNAKTNPSGPDLYRSGIIATAQVPVIIALGGRNSPIRYILGGGEAKTVNRLHKLSGRVCFVTMLLHVLGFSIKWAIAGTFIPAAKKPFIIWGFVSTGSLAFMILTSFPFFRRRLYSLFMICHIIGLAGFLLGLAMHVPYAVPYCIAGAAIYAFELVCRAGKTRVTTAELRVISGAESVVITIGNLKSGWRAGQHVILRVPALPKKGGFRFIEGHAFTIASAPSTDGIVLIAKRTGDWTRALYDMAAGSKGPESFRAGKTTTKVIVEGPYGGPGNNLFDSYGAVMLVAGGSGITHTLGVTATLISKAASHGSVRASFLNVIWIVRTQDVARPLMSTFRSLIEDAKLAQCNLAVRFQIYVTRESAAEINLLSNAAKDQMNAPVTMPGTMTSGGVADLPISWPCGTNSRIEIIAGSRPAFNGLLTELIDSAVSFDEEMGLARQGCGIAVCGPSGLCDSVRTSVQRIDAKRKLRVGGIELLEESFS